MADNARGEKRTYVIGPVYSAVQRLVLRTGNNGTNETDGFFRQARRRPAAVWGIRQGAATTHGGKRRCFMFRYLRFVTLVSRGNRGRSPRSRSRKRLNSRSFRVSANAATTSRYPYVAPYRSPLIGLMSLINIGWICQLSTRREPSLAAPLTSAPSGTR